MITLKNQHVQLEVSEDAQLVQVRDLERRVIWRLDPDSTGLTLAHQPNVYQSVVPWPLDKLPAMKAARRDAGSLTLTLSLPGGEPAAVYLWQLTDQGLTITLNVKDEHIQHLTLPGSFRAVDQNTEYLLGTQQGLLLRNTGPREHHRHIAGMYANLAMIGYLTQGAGLLVSMEGDRDWTLLWGRHDTHSYASFEVAPCAAKGWYTRRVTLTFTPGNITAIAKAYRRELIAADRFVPWSVKRQAKPAVDKLFGSLFAFTGYMQGRHTDYVANAKRLKEMGFDRVLYYPLRFATITGGDEHASGPRIELDDNQLKQIQQIGGLVAPWIWCTETLDTGGPDMDSLYAQDPKGQRMLQWEMDGNQYFAVCPTAQRRFIDRQLRTRLAKMDWMHFDVTANRGGGPCCHPDHHDHAGKPLTARDANALLTEMLSPRTVGNRLVSSEGFNEPFAAVCDILSKKSPPSWGDAQCITVPLTMLIFHDSVIHTWWELHVYNDLGGHSPTKGGLLEFTSGNPEKRAAMDALYGSPPLVFPYGRQFAWVEKVFGDTFAFEVSLDEPEVQRALRAALPVTRLHQRIGPLEMTEFEFLSEDHAVQRTVFEDGTTIVANLGDEPRDVAGLGSIPADTWREL